MVLAGELSRLCLICIAIVEFALSAPTAAGAVLAPKALRVSSLRTIPLSRASWFWSSAPLYDMGDTLAPATPVPATLAEHAQASWYDPPRDPSTRFAIERDLNPVLTAEDGGGDLHNVLEMNLQPPTGQSGLTASNWAGLTQSLSTVGYDFSSLRYLEIWVNDFTPNHALTQAKLHIDLGQVSEDAFWNPSSPPNGRLDTEDKNGDGRLDINSVDNLTDEDTGLDGLHDSEEPGYTGPGSDPNHDDYAYDRNNAGDYSRINGTERNGTGDPNARVDTEDLDRDGYLDTQNDYFEATIDLADTNYVAIDVPRDYANNPDVVGTIRADNGWRLFRIPVSGTAVQERELRELGLRPACPALAERHGGFGDDPNRRNRSCGSGLQPVVVGCSVPHLPESGQRRGDVFDSAATSWARSTPALRSPGSPRQRVVRRIHAGGIADAHLGGQGCQRAQGSVRPVSLPA